MRKIKMKNVGVTVLLWVLVCSILVSGCEPLRKKFTRTKKTSVESSEFEPILSPIEYPERVYDPVADYKYRLSLFRVWQKEFISGIQDNTHTKRLQYLMNSILTQVEEMQKLLVGNKAVELGKEIKVLKECQDGLNKPEAFQDLQAMERKMKTVSKSIIANFSFKSVEGDIKK
ncbi:MAG: hypothetical protein PHY73_02925 [Candidatus Omnitrophica bacterium]|nr:hypothetical protein [Candidatus Omnitrophota bacterium]